MSGSPAACSRRKTACNPEPSTSPKGKNRYNPNPANPSNDQEKFATYTRDSATGLDYAYQRYYSSGIVRFMTQDPYQATPTSKINPGDPATWNRYICSGGDPINHFDLLGIGHSGWSHDIVLFRLCCTPRSIWCPGRRTSPQLQETLYHSHRNRGLFCETT
ncbi:MAG: hypothetical protein JO061_16355 [Acidobacteriaceae bacterium]|nr:hypothetical protein [Acidobacteriaceae bacterium]